jgi:hypothetical protein
MGLLFWSAAVLVAYPGRMLPQHVLLLWALGIAVLWAGALPLAALRARAAGPEPEGWEVDALVEGAPGGVVDAAVRALGEMGADEVEGSAATGTARARLPGRPAVRLRLHVLAEGAAFRILAEAVPLGRDREGRARSAVREVVDGMAAAGFRVQAGEERSWPLRGGSPAWAGYAAAAALGAVAGATMRLIA